MTQHPELFAALAAPFEPTEVKVRTHVGRQLHYVTARTVMNRLDQVLGPENWWDEYDASENSVLCRLTIRLPDGQLLTKADAGGYAGMADSGDDDKSGYSDAFKRAGVKFGIARYLYRDGVPDFVRLTPAATATATATPVPAAEAQIDPNAPTTGRQLWAWLAEKEKRHAGIKSRFHTWSRAKKLPVKILGWDSEQVQRGYAAARAAIEDLERGVPQNSNGNGKH